jgi:hypothetical protein
MKVDIVQFFLSWGLDPEDDHSEISEKVYERMLNAAEVEGGKEFKEFVQEKLDAVDGWFFLNFDSWNDIIT